MNNKNSEASEKARVCYDRPGPVDEEEEFNDEYYQEAGGDQEETDQWLPTGMFTKSQKG